MGLETEVKFKVEDFSAVREQLLAAGAKQIQPRTLEVNLRFDDAKNGLRAAGVVLRLRQDTRATLTLKLPVGPWSTQAKTLRELEVEVSDFETARQILEGLGFSIWFIYEKHRTVYHLAEAEICLDELPFGCFVEIEGSLEQIGKVTGRLEMAGAERITTGYYTLFQQAKGRLNLPFNDCTFANWQTVG